MSALCMRCLDWPINAKRHKSAPTNYLSASALAWATCASWWDWTWAYSVQPETSICVRNHRRVGSGNGWTVCTATMPRQFQPDRGVRLAKHLKVRRSSPFGRRWRDVHCWPTHQFGAIPSDFTSGPTTSTSALINLRNSSDVAVLVSTPLSCSRAASCGSREAMMNSLFKRSTIAFGVPAGADTAYQPLAFFLS